MRFSISTQPGNLLRAPVAALRRGGKVLLYERPLPLYTALEKDSPFARRLNKDDNEISRVAEFTHYVDDGGGRPTHTHTHTFATEGEKGRAIYIYIYTHKKIAAYLDYLPLCLVTKCQSSRNHVGVNIFELLLFFFFFLFDSHSQFVRDTLQILAIKTFAVYNRED